MSAKRAVYAPSPRPDIVAVTVTYNSSEVLDEFLDCTQRQQGDWRLVIIDNASTDGTRDRLAKISDNRIHVILSDRNSGFAAGSNKGIVYALEVGAEAVLLINNDTSFASDLFQKLSEKLRSSHYDAVSPLILFEKNPDRVWYAGGSIQWKRAVRNCHDHFGESVSHIGEDELIVEFMPLCCAAIKRNVFEKIGLIDEDYFVYWEDVDFSHRMNMAGLHAILSPKITMLHKESSLTGGLMSEFSTKQYYKNRMIFVRKSLGLAGTVLQLGLISCAVLGRTLLKGDSISLLGLRFKSVWDGLTTKITPPQNIAKIKQP